MTSLFVYYDVWLKHVNLFFCHVYLKSMLNKNRVLFFTSFLQKRLCAHVDQSKPNFSFRIPVP